MTVVSVLLVGVAFLLVRWHRKQWRRQQVDVNLTERDREFYRNQHRRRMQVSVMLGLTGVGLFVGSFISPRQFPTLAVCWWGGTISLVAWVAVLGLADMVAIRNFARVKLDRIDLEKHILESQLRSKVNGERSGDE